MSSVWRSTRIARSSWACKMGKELRESFALQYVASISPFESDCPYGSGQIPLWHCVKQCSLQACGQVSYETADRTESQVIIIVWTASIALHW